jgi:hypothetical protein
MKHWIWNHVGSWDPDPEGWTTPRNLAHSRIMTVNGGWKSIMERCCFVVTYAGLGAKDYATLNLNWLTVDL